MNLSARLAKLETATIPAGRIIPIRARDQDDVDAQLAEMDRLGQRKPNDTVVITMWLPA